MQTPGAPIMQWGEYNKRSVSMSIWKWPEAYLWHFQHKPLKNGVPYLLKPEGSLKVIKILYNIIGPEYLLSFRLLISSQAIYSDLMTTLDIEILKRKQTEKTADIVICSPNSKSWEFQKLSSFHETCNKNRRLTNTTTQMHNNPLVRPVTIKKCILTNINKSKQ